MGNTKKQTAVDWIIKQLEKQKQILKDHFEEGKWNEDRCSEIDNCILICEQAKQIEKEQIMDAYNDGNESDHNNEFGDGGNKHYTETYNNETDGK